MATIKNFEDLEIWQKAIKLSDELYELCQIDFLKKDYSPSTSSKYSSSSDNFLAINQTFCSTL